MKSLDEKRRFSLKCFKVHFICPVHFLADHAKYCMATKVKSFKTSRVNIAPYFPGEYSYETVTIEGVSIRNDVIQLDIYESIFTNAITGTLLVTDDQNLISSLPILGGETLRIKISTRSTTDVLDKEFYVTKVSEIQKTSITTQMYKIHFCSKSLILSERQNVSKSFMNKLSEDVVVSVFDSHLDGSELFYAQSDNEQCLVVPNWRPFKACVWLASRAQSSLYENSPYIFFENLDGHYFIPMDMLHSDIANPAIDEIKIDPIRMVGDGNRELSNTYDQRMKVDNLMFESYQIVKTIDSLENLALGMYANIASVIKVRERVWKNYEYDYIDEFLKSKHLTGTKVDPTVYPMVKDGSPLVHNDSPYRRIITHYSGLFSQDKNNSADYDKFTHTAVSKFQQMNNFKVQGTIPGYISLRAGMKIDLELPALNQATKIKRWETDKRYSGKFIIGSIRHTFQPDKFYQTIQLYKDSLGINPNLMTSNIEVENE